MQTFVLNDESQVNSYGFRIPNKGIDLTRFNANPVMLADHNNSVDGVIGKWVNLRFSGSKLLADPDFDLHKPAAREIAGQVYRGYLKGASMGVSFDKDYMQKASDGVAELSRCQKYESSICAIPSNSNAVRLYASSTGQLMSDAMVKLNLQGLNVQPQNGQYAAANMQEALVLLNSAILHGLVLSESKDSWIEMAMTNYTLFKSTIDNLLDKNNIAAITLSSFQAMPLEAQLAFKNHNPDSYKSLFKPDQSINKVTGSPVFSAVNLSTVTTVDGFYNLSDAQKLDFRDNHKESYMRLFGKDIFGRPLKNQNK